MTERNPNELRTKDFDYDLPTNLIAQTPLEDRSSSKLLIYKDNKISDHVFTDIVNMIPENSLLILNDTKVIPGRMLGRTAHGGNIEIMLLEPYKSNQIPNSTTSHWKAMGKPMKKLKPGSRIFLDNNLEGLILERNEQQQTTTILVEFNLNHSDFLTWLEKHGYVPLPPYIKRDKPTPAIQNSDRQRYQTVFAQSQGSVAAPTAGLHMTEAILKKLKKRNINLASVTLHVGGGTFLPVKTEIINQHEMHSENFIVPKTTFEKITLAQKENRPIVTMGTTTFRALQGFKKLVSDQDTEDYLDRWISTDIFIYPKTRDDIFRPWAVTGIITNFHQPKSTLFMLICSLIGYENALKCYDHAKRKNYRFFSYGDSSLLWFPEEKQLCEF